MHPKYLISPLRQQDNRLGEDVIDHLVPHLLPHSFSLPFSTVSLHPSMGQHRTAVKSFQLLTILQRQLEDTRLCVDFRR